MRYVGYVVLCLVFAGLTACSETMPESYEPLPTAITVADFNLYNQHAQVINKSAFAGKWSLLFFGYTYCPDVCPTTLAEMNRVAADVTGSEFQVVLVSVDPERDNAAVLKNYIEYFNPKFQAWSGELPQLEGLARQLHIFFQKQPYGDSYLMDHSSQVVLVNPQGEYVGFFTAPLKSEEMAGYLNQVM